MDQRRCTFIQDDMCVGDPVMDGDGGLYDITSSSLIKSPLVFELLISHGLLKEETSGCIEKQELPSPKKVYQVSNNHSLQPQAIVNDDDDEDDEGVYTCGWEACEQAFNFREELASHVNNIHVNSDKSSPHRCLWTGCIRQGREISARYRMQIHMRTHTHEKPHACDICGKKFSRLENLRIHIRSHTGEKPYICSVDGCNKAFSNSSDRFKHSKTHQEDKPYACRVEGCDKRYTDPSSLRKHMKSSAHGGESKQKLNSENSDQLFENSSKELAEISRPFVKNAVRNVYKCRVQGCEKRYTDPSSLRKHMKSTHRGENQPCKTSENNNDVSKKHQVLTKSDERSKPYACKVEGCNKRYTDPSSLRKHQRATSHGRDPNNLKIKNKIITKDVQQSSQKCKDVSLDKLSNAPKLNLENNGSSIPNSISCTSKSEENSSLVNNGFVKELKNGIKSCLDDSKKVTEKFKGDSSKTSFNKTEAPKPLDLSASCSLSLGS